jgi:hypothetical protein
MEHDQRTGGLFLKEKFLNRLAAPEICHRTNKCPLSRKNLVLRTIRQTLPTQGLPLLPDNHFEKAHGAPVSWETFNRSKPQNELEKMRQSRGKKKHNASTTRFHIFASLPGLNI